jgi:hypothetical protein
VKQRNCAYCGKLFESKRIRLCCDRSCSGKLSQAKKGKLAWQADELGILETWIGSEPMEAIAKRIQRLDKKRGWPVRSTTAIYVKAKRLYPSVRPVVDNFTRNEIANILGINAERVRMWTRTHGLEFKRRHRSGLSIKASQFRSWAYDHPEKLAGVRSERLDYLMNDLEFCKHVEQLPYTGVGIAKPVKNLSTGQTFKSAREAAKATYISRRSIADAIERNGKSAGYRWEYIGEAVN